MKLSVIIVNYNVKFFLEQCLQSVIKAIQNIDCEIFVVDNNSTDDSKSFFREKFATIKFIWNNKNYGFAKANNLALAPASGRYILFLNPDTIVPEDCFEKCILFLETHANAGALGIHMIDGSGKFLKESKRSFPSPMTSLYKLSGLAKLFPRSKLFSKYYLGNLEENQNHEVDVLAGAFMMVRKNIIDDLGGFDESFFMYGEDIDLSFRIQKAGHKNFYFSESSILHFKGESTKKGSLNYVVIFYKAMSIFVKKHNGGGKAGIFSFLMQAAILLRASVSAAGRFIRWVGMPAIDACIILISFWLVKLFWNTYVKQEVNYSLNVILIAFPVFTIIFLMASYFSGLYDNGYKQSRLNRSALSAFLILLAGYSLLPETLRFSRGILVFGSVLAYGLITVARWFLLKVNILEKAEDSDERGKTIIAGTNEEFASVKILLQRAGLEKRILGRIALEDESESKTIGNINQLNNLINIYPVKEVILCAGGMSFKEIIAIMRKLPHNLSIKIFGSNTESIIGSNSKNLPGNYVAVNSNYKLATLINKRNKQLADLIISTTFILTFPVHFFLQRKPHLFFRNVADVFFKYKTWVSYASNAATLPQLKPGVLSVTGRPPNMNLLPEENLALADIWYAENYNVWQDVQLVWRNYKFLGE